MGRSGGYYYFLMSSLPSLRWDAPPPLSSDDLLGQAGEWLSSRDVARLERIGLLPEPPPVCRVAGEWLAFETGLRNALVVLRARKYGAATEDYLREAPSGSVWIDRRLGEIATMEDPWERETALDRLRWDFLEEAGGPDPFTFDALAAYRLRLLLLEKRAQYVEQQGAGVLDTLVKQLTGRAADVRRVAEHGEHEA